MTEELKPCPFCGVKISFADTDAPYGGNEVFIKCECKNFFNSDEEALKWFNSAWCWKEIDRLKKAAEDEFQRAEGKEEMKKWFQVKIVELEAKNEEMRKEIEEQCLLLGKSGSREADLLAEIDLLKKELCRVYSSDGSFVELRIPEEAISRQIGAAQEADRLKARNEKIRKALEVIPPIKLRQLSNWVKSTSNIYGDVEEDLNRMADLSEAALQDGGKE